MTRLEKVIRERIARDGPMDVPTFMEMAVTHYYGTRDPLGAKGDFTTAPEISQMFGELIGAWAADVWMKLGSPPAFQLIECGPGRGTLMADALRAGGKAPGFAKAAQIVMIENSPVLISKQKAALRQYHVEWADTAIHPVIQGSKLPVIMLANEFLDALPVKQTVGAAERRITIKGGRLVFEPSGGTPHETSPAREAFVRQTARLLKARTGAALFIDYGHDVPGAGETLQAVREHQYVDALDFVGEADLTAHVDFGTLRRVAMEEGAAVSGPVGQGDFLRRLGIAERADVLLGSARDIKQRGAIAAALARLTASEQMGRLFRVMAVCHDAGLGPEGF